VQFAEGTGQAVLNKIIDVRGIYDAGGDDEAYDRLDRCNLMRRGCGDLFSHRLAVLLAVGLAIRDPLGKPGLARLLPRFAYPGARRLSRADNHGRQLLRNAAAAPEFQ
jgi:hypothetical protein